MPKSKYEFIYKDLKQKIESEEYAYQELLPSENQLVLAYNCSRNTIRRAVGRLVTDGYVQTMQGKGVRNIYRPVAQTSYTIGGIESFKESSIRNHKKGRSVVLQFMELTADEKISRRTGFPVGSELYYIQRLHFLDEKPLIINHNYFLKSTNTRSSVGNCRKFYLRISGKHPPHDHCQQQAGDDSRKNHSDR